MANGGLEIDIPYPYENCDITNKKMANVFAAPAPPPDCEFHTIILDCSSWSFIDTVGIDVLMSVSTFCYYINL